MHESLIITVVYTHVYAHRHARRHDFRRAAETETQRERERDDAYASDPASLSILSRSLSRADLLQTVCADIKCLQAISA